MSKACCTVVGSFLAAVSEAEAAIFRFCKRVQQCDIMWSPCQLLFQDTCCVSYKCIFQICTMKLWVCNLLIWVLGLGFSSTSRDGSLRYLHCYFSSCSSSLSRLLCPEQVLWALCVYVEAVSVLPQLRMMQKAKVTPQSGTLYCVPCRQGCCCCWRRLFSVSAIITVQLWMVAILMPLLLIAM